MVKSTDWLPGARMAILAMCMKWPAYMTEELRTLWGALQARFTALGNLALGAPAP